MSVTNAEIAVNLQSKFEFYLLGLTFAILGLSVQTAVFGVSMVADGFELLGWLSLLASGLVGILRGEWVPVAYRIMSKQESLERKISQIEEAAQHGIDLHATIITNGVENDVNGAAAIQEFRATIAKLEIQLGSVSF